MCDAMAKVGTEADGQPVASGFNAVSPPKED
jgi:hypothetical protein